MKVDRAIAKLKQIWMGGCSLIWIGVTCISAPLPVWGNTTVSTLEQQLQAAVAQNNWSQAIQIVDLLIPLVPQQASQLQGYRSQLEQLSHNRSSSPIQTRIQPASLGLVPIKRREHGVPVVDVAFNQRRTFEMLVDSGASLTVITRSMATALGITSAHVVQNITVQTANGETTMPIVYVSAVTVGGLTTQQVPVAIAGPDMELGLLGQDFLQRYDVSLRRDRIEFHDR
ncbi:MAG: retropepsin-like aspartic protease [Thermosynechococcaceae cyanobacterium]